MKVFFRDSKLKVYSI